MIATFRQPFVWSYCSFTKLCLVICHISVDQVWLNDPLIDKYMYIELLYGFGCIEILTVKMLLKMIAVTINSLKLFPILWEANMTVSV